MLFGHPFLDLKIRCKISTSPLMVARTTSEYSLTISSTFNRVSSLELGVSTVTVRRTRRIRDGKLNLEGRSFRR
jgi:hypothetical protein